MHSRFTSKGAGRGSSGSSSRVALRHRPGSCHPLSVTLLCANGEIRCFATVMDRSFRYPSWFIVDRMFGSVRGAVKTLIYRLRKRHSEILREEVARTVTDALAIDGEIQSLCAALIASEGRLSSLSGSSGIGRPEATAGQTRSPVNVRQ